MFIQSIKRGFASCFDFNSRAPETNTDYLSDKFKLLIDLLNN